MRTVLILFVMALMLVGCVPHIVVAKDMCVRYEASWLPEKNILPQTLCVCTADVFTGLESALSTMLSQPDTIEIAGIVLPKDCSKPQNPIVNEGDAEVKDMLTR